MNGRAALSPYEICLLYLHLEETCLEAHYRAMEQQYLLLFPRSDALF